MQRKLNNQEINLRFKEVDIDSYSLNALIFCYLAKVVDPSEFWVSQFETQIKKIKLNDNFKTIR